MKPLRPAISHKVQYRGGAYEQLVDTLGREIATPYATLMILDVASFNQRQTAARDLAKKLGKTLYRIDLASVISKYIGETEKNLDALFGRAAASGGILFFDEADALFGKRTTVKDAHDRYANQEISYLLKKIEHHRGTIILTSPNKAYALEKVRQCRKIHIKFPPFG